MKSPIRLLLTGALLAWSSGVPLLAAPEQDAIAAVKKTTDELVAADKAAAAAHTALLAAHEALNTTRFGSAAYNARISAQQVSGAKDRYEKATPEAKLDALEAYELAQEIDAQRKTALEAAEKALPEKEAAAKTANDKYAQVLKAAETTAGTIRDIVRQGEAEVQAKLKDSKVAIEKAAFAKATAEQQTAANAAILKTFSDLDAAEKSLAQAAQALKQAPENDRARKLADAEKATRAYLLAIEAVTAQVPSLCADGSGAAPLIRLSAAFVKADEAAQKATAAQQQARQSLEEKTKAVQQTTERIQAAEADAEKRIAKIRAQKDLAREREALKRAETVRAEAEQQLPPKTAAAEQAQAACKAALQSAVQALGFTAEPQSAMASEKAAIARAITERAAQLKNDHTAIAREAATAEAAAEKAKAALSAAEKASSQKVAIREALLKVMRQRFIRDARLAYDEFSRHEAALTAANRTLQTKTSALAKASDISKQAQASLATARKDAEAQAALLAKLAKEKQSAENTAQEKLALRTAADRKQKDAEAALKAAREAVAAATAETRAEADKDLHEAEASAQEAAGQARLAADATKVADAALERARVASRAVEKRSNDAARTLKAAEQKCAAAQAALDKAATEKTAAEKATEEPRRAVDAAVAKLAAAQAGTRGGLKPLDASAWTLEKARHLMVRAGFGGTPDEVARLHALGLHGAVSHFVDFKKLPAPEIGFAASVKEKPQPYESVLISEEQRRLRQARADKDRRQLQDMRAWWLRRMVESPRPLEEKLALFWHGQIPVQFTTVGDSYYMYLQNALFRDHGAGNFATMLHGIAHDAAMLKYLNNDTNVKGRANENLAREIMELFSMGRDQGYTEIDIRQGARALTGYTYDVDSGQFRFISDRHDNEPKTIFGKTGNYSGDDFVRLILDTPYPAKFIARQIFSFFAYSEPSIDTVESLATVLRLSNYELAPMLENLFLSEEFYSTRAMNTEVKSPVQLIVGLHRDLGLKNPDYAYLATAVRDMGQDLFEPPSVFGWQLGRPWITTSRILSRYNVLAEILERRPRAGKSGVDVVGTVLSGRTLKTHAEVVDYLAKCVWSVPLPESKRQAMIEFLKPLPEPAQWAENTAAVNARLTRLLVMLMCSPEAQLS